jgi:hypothetical protein
LTRVAKERNISPFKVSNPAVSSLYQNFRDKVKKASNAGREALPGLIAT